MSMIFVCSFDRFRKRLCFVFFMRHQRGKSFYFFNEGRPVLKNLFGLFMQKMESNGEATTRPRTSTNGEACNWTTRSHVRLQLTKQRSLNTTKSLRFILIVNSHHFRDKKWYKYISVKIKTYGFEVFHK